MLRPVGPLVQEDAAEFRRRLMELRQSSLGRFIVDAAAVPYADSRGLEVLLDVHEELARAGQSLKLCGLNETLREVLTLTELSACFEHFEDTGAAVRSFL